jgi:pyruvate-formate lyase-activating enzyme
MDDAAPFAPRAKFDDPDFAADGQRRAEVALARPETLWFNTGTLCNIACARCYIESSPRNDRLAYLTLAEVEDYLDQLEARRWGVREIGFTGGEPFLNPEMAAMAEAALGRGYEALILTNAMRPMTRPRPLAALARLVAAHGSRLTLRVSLDHHDAGRHDAERGAGAFAETLEGMRLLREMGARLAVAARTLWNEPEAEARAGFAALFAREGFVIDADSPSELTLFPEMEAETDPPEITEACWGALGKRPQEVMCASSRMVVKRRGAPRPGVVACTLLPYDPRFELGSTLAEAERPVKLNHPWCASFCVLGGGRCSR